jgi:redox-sensitive bicupin YhaK (pirin superfamily)
MTTQLHKASDRGTANFGWLNANYSFSFANYFNPQRIQFGMLRVLNDDTIAPGMGFGTHPHENMEIITIPLEGALKHQDSMGNEGTISFGEVQVMSAGSGIQHSEVNASQTNQLKLLQLWVFPDAENVTPRYEQKFFDLEKNSGSFVNIVSPKDSNNGNALWVHQKTYFNLGIFESGKTSYKINLTDNSVYLFLIDGEIVVDNQLLKAKDALAISDFSEFDIEIKQKAKMLIIEVPAK